MLDAQVVYEQAADEDRQEPRTTRWIPSHLVKAQMIFVERPSSWEI